MFTSTIRRGPHLLCVVAGDNTPEVLDHALATCLDRGIRVLGWETSGGRWVITTPMCAWIFNDGPFDIDTEPRAPGCQCHREAGDSPCRVHGDSDE